MTRKAILYGIFCVATAVATDITVCTTGGRITGAVEPTWGIPIARFLGIPYAKPPLGTLRYRPPEPAPPWQGILETKEFRAACAQANGSFPPDIPWLVDKRIVSEDCLFLNIWVPQTCTKRKAILIWIHGGGFRTGTPSTELYDGKLLAAVGDIMVVSVAYRLGSLGFLYTGEDSSPGNYGLLDQELAIHWIRNNAEVFGGDRSSITLYGESAGSSTVGLHLLATRNAGIVRRAIMASTSPYGQIRPQSEVGRELATKLAKAVGCEVDGNDWIRVVACLRSAPIEAILRAEDTQYPQNLATFTPSYGDSYLPLSFHETLRDPKLIPIDALLIGVTAHEGSIFLHIKDPERFNMNNEPEGLTYSEALALLACPYYPGLPKALQEATIGIFQAYVHQGEGILQSLINTVGDFIITCPTIFFAEAYARLNYPVYFYVFDHRSVKSRLPPWMAAAHFTELQYTFGMPFRFPERYTDLDRKQSMLMMNLFTHFINTGRPTLPDGSEWPTYTKEDPYHQSIRDIFLGLPPPFLVVGDINAHHPRWGSARTDRRGIRWVDVIGEMDLCLLNDGSPTFLRRDFSTDVLDVSICSKDVSRSLSWSTDVDGKGSDHLPIYISCDRVSSLETGTHATFWDDVLYKVDNSGKKVTKSKYIDLQFSY
ncbi:cholinesterase 1-like [Ornithodoros turicata]|uniref:cholinesterase 1-like n=1 Tax=Ornithodoros turicata TaxID=34597 RepID=UPI003138ABAE